MVTLAVVKHYLSLENLRRLDASVPPDITEIEDEEFVSLINPDFETQPTTNILQLIRDGYSDDTNPNPKNSLDRLVAGTAHSTELTARNWQAYIRNKPIIGRQELERALRLRLIHTPSLDLSDTLLERGIDLRNLHLKGATLKGICLYKANLNCTDLSGANLTDSNLESANFSNANLAYANLNNATMRGAYFVEADLEGVSSRLAILTGADLSHANLVRANLFQANLISANMTQADLTDASLRWAKLRNAILNGAKLRNANLSRAMLNGANLSNADLKGANLEAAYLNSIIDNTTQFDGALIWHTRLPFNFSSEQLSKAIVLNPLNIEGGNFQRYSLHGKPAYAFEQIRPFLKTIPAHLLDELEYISSQIPESKRNGFYSFIMAVNYFYIGAPIFFNSVIQSLSSLKGNDLNRLVNELYRISLMPLDLMQAFFEQQYKERSALSEINNKKYDFLLKNTYQDAIKRGDFIGSILCLRSLTLEEKFRLLFHLASLMNSEGVNQNNILTLAKAVYDSISSKIHKDTVDSKLKQFQSTLAGQFYLYFYNGGPTLDVVWRRYCEKKYSKDYLRELIKASKDYQLGLKEVDPENEDSLIAGYIALNEPAMDQIWYGNPVWSYEFYKKKIKEIAAADKIPPRFLNHVVRFELSRTENMTASVNSGQVENLAKVLASVCNVNQLRQEFQFDENENLISSLQHAYHSEAKKDARNPLTQQRKTKLLLALAYHQEGLDATRTQIEKYIEDKKQIEIPEILQALHLIFEDALSEELTKFNTSPTRAISKMRDQLSVFQNQIKQIQVGKALVELIPSKKRLDVFAGYIMEDCTKNRGDEILSPDFMDYWMRVDGQVEGMINVNRVDKKLTIAIGPRRQLNVSMTELLEGIEKGLLTVIERENYKTIFISTDKNLMGNLGTMATAIENRRYAVSKHANPNSRIFETGLTPHYEVTNKGGDIEVEVLGFDDYIAKYHAPNRDRVLRSRIVQYRSRLRAKQFLRSTHR